MRTRSNPARIERVADRADAAVHHVGGRDHVGAGLGLDQRLAAQDRHRLVIGDVAVAHHAVMAMRGEGVERHVAHDAEIGMRLLHRPHGAADEIVGIDRLFAVGRLALVRRRRKDRDERNAQRLRLARGIDERRDRQPVDARHGGDRHARRAASWTKTGQMKIGGGQAMLRHQAARPVVAAVAAQADAGIGAKRLGRDAGQGAGLEIGGGIGGG